MKRVLIPILAAAVCATALGQTKKEFLAFLDQVEPASTRAFVNKDVKWFEGIALPDFTYISHDGQKSDRKASLSSMKAMFGVATKIKVFTKRGSVSLNGSVGTVQYDATYHLTLKPGQDKKTHIMTVKAKTRESWKKLGGAWKLLSITDTAPAEFLMDGKPAASVGGG